MVDWNPLYGDRCQEIVFIGINMNKEEIEQNIRDCLLTDEEMEEGPDVWKIMTTLWSHGLKTSNDNNSSNIKP